MGDSESSSEWKEVGMGDSESSSEWKEVGLGEIESSSEVSVVGLGENILNYIGIGLELGYRVGCSLEFLIAP